jgi:hypothetical protein
VAGRQAVKARSVLSLPLFILNDVFFFWSVFANDGITVALATLCVIVLFAPLQISGELILVGLIELHSRLSTVLIA